jgi:multidrug efflux pump subunit AcrA (membrane-fusion protein)
MEKASGLVDQLRAKAVPYMAMAEMATGRTQAGLSHMQAARAHFEEQQARLQAAQARIEVERARLVALAAAQQQLKHMNVLADYPAASDMVIEVPGVKVSQDGIVVRGRHGVVVCPRTQMHMPVVDVPTPQISVMHDPI